MSGFITVMGPLFWVMIFFIVLSLAVLAERLVYFSRISIDSTSFLQGLNNLIRQGKYAEALHEAQALPGPIARVVEAVLSRPKLQRSELRDIALESASMEVYRVERNIRILLVSATITPLLGILGTMLSLMEFYEQPGMTEGAAAAPELAETLYQALMHSTMGIALAIPFYLFYMYLAAKARKVVNKVERAGLETVHIICDNPQGDA
ncbi:MAG: MotA/TolQ/ExbB proton channel family protein [Akkermansia sp.]